MIIALAVAGAVVAGVARRLVRTSILLTLPIAISVVLVSVFTRPGDTVLFTIGPFDATAEGVDFAAQTLVRLLAISTSIGLFGLTTDPRAFVLDLERRGISPRFAFVALATLEAVPAMVERAGVIQASQRARGLDTEGSVAARLRGVLPLVGPVILSSLTEVEERSLALEVAGLRPAGQAPPALAEPRLHHPVARPSRAGARPGRVGRRPGCRLRPGDALTTRCSS